MIKDNFQTFIHKLNLSMLYIAQNTKKMQLNCYHQNENLRNCLGHWASSNNNQNHLHQKMLEKKISIQGSLYFVPKEARGDVPLTRLI